MSFPAPPSDKKMLEEGAAFTPKFDANGLIVCVTVEHSSGEILMLAYMNELALEKTLETGLAHYWSRSRNELWRKGDTSGQVQKVIEMRVDCDQDAILLRVEAGGDGKACHTGRKSCFYRSVTQTAEAALLRMSPDDGETAPQRNL
jgi:phosphoribosyl-AMP cyclohydrolase